jgi:tetratricopeptide (TPR) repeat protein
MHESGSDIALVSPLVSEASDHYKKAVEIAPSDSFVALKLISTTVFQLKILNQAGKLVAPDLILDIQKVRHDILSITSINGDVYHAFGLFYLYYALNLHYNNGLPQPWFDLAESHFISATNHSTTSGNIWLSFARLYSFIVKFQRELNLDTSESTQKAIDALSNVPDNARDYYYFNEIGTLNRYQALQVRDNKGDATELFKIAIFNYIEANRRFPEHIGSLINAASATIKMSVDYLVEDKYVALQEAKLILARVLSKEPSHFVANYYLSIIYIDLFELSLYQGFAIDGIVKEAASQMSRTKLVNKVHPYVLDLEQKLKQFELEKSFSDAGQWHSGFDELIALRIQLAEKFQRNPIVTRNLIGVLCGITGIRIQLGLPAASYVKQLEQALKQYPEFENVDAYRALSQLFSHWHDSDIAKLNLITKFKLRHKSSFAHQWALAMVLLATAQNQQAIDEAIKLLNTNHGILPAYRQLILKWADEKAQMLNKNQL